MERSKLAVIPAKAGIEWIGVKVKVQFASCVWIPAFAGRTTYLYLT